MVLVVKYRVMGFKLSLEFYPKRSVSESDMDPLNSTVNLRGNPNQFDQPDQAGFIDESQYRGPGTHLQSQQGGIETRIAGVIEWFEGLKLEIIEWDNCRRCHAVS